MADTPELSKGERQMIARARHAFTRLVGMEKGDQLADELIEMRLKRKQHP